MQSQETVDKTFFILSTGIYVYITFLFVFFLSLYSFVFSARIFPNFVKRTALLLCRVHISEVICEFSFLFLFQDEVLRDKYERMTMDQKRLERQRAFKEIGVRAVSDVVLALLRQPCGLRRVLLLHACSELQPWFAVFWYCLRPFSHAIRMFH